MTYLLIAIILAIILSPLLSLKSSTRLKQQEVMRRLAREEGIHVQMSRKVDARDDEKALESICYRLGWGRSTAANNGKDLSGVSRGWTLVQGGMRGMEADWPNWRWFEGPAPSVVNNLLNMVVPELPQGVDGVKVDQGGVAIFWDERGTENDARSIVTALKILRDQLLLIDTK